MREGIPVKFTYQNQEHTGELMPVSGAGSATVFHLMIDGYYRGMLHVVRDEWVFHNNKNEMSEIADVLGSFVTSWHDEQTRR